MPHTHTMHAFETIYKYCTSFCIYNNSPLLNASANEDRPKSEQQKKINREKCKTRESKTREVETRELLTSVGGGERENRKKKSCFSLKLDWTFEVVYFDFANGILVKDENLTVN